MVDKSEVPEAAAQEPVGPALVQRSGGIPWGSGGLRGQIERKSLFNDRYTVFRRGCVLKRNQHRHTCWEVPGHGIAKERNSRECEVRKENGER